MLKVRMKDVQRRIKIGPGLYNVKVTNLEVKESQNGNDMIVLQLAIQDRGDFKGRVVTDRLVFSDGAMWRVDAAICALLGPQSDKDYEVNPQDLMGATAQVHLTNRIWAVEDGGDGQPRPQVSSWIVPDMTDATELTEDQIPF